MAGQAHARLRESTHALHRLLDDRAGLAMGPSREDYCGYLLMNWPCVSIEEGLAIAGIQRLLPDWDARRRRDSLTRDLAQLGVQPPGVGPLTIAQDIGTLLGWSYVIEGSRLGAGVVLRRLAGCDADISAATSFVQHGENKNYWVSFKQTLARIDGDENAILKACTGARAAFERFL